MPQILLKSLYNDLALSSKHLILLIAFLNFIHAQHGTSFFICHPYQALSSSTFFRVFKAKQQLECAQACTRNSQCKSFNFGAGQDMVGRRTCQLLTVDMMEASLTVSKKLHHYQMFYPEPCSSNPCQNGGKCTTAIGTREITCDCPLGFSGNRCQTMHWVKFNSGVTCFGATNDQFATFDIINTGNLVTIRLVHVSGKLNCDAAYLNGWNYWGCYDTNGNYEYMSVVITDNTNFLKMPDSGFIGSPQYKVWKSAGLYGRSKELVFPKLKSAVQVVSGEKYRIWFGQDLDNQSDNNNSGLVCVDVYGLYE